MKEQFVHVPNPSLDLLLERTVDIPKEKVWEAWTNPELMVKWFTPAPWGTESIELDLRPGGKFKTVMRSPEGEIFDHAPGCVLEVIENQKFVWTSAMEPGYRPRVAGEGEFLFTAVITLEDFEGGTKYSALAIHLSPEDCQTHESMGFSMGWGAAFDQLVALVKGGGVGG